MRLFVILPLVATVLLAGCGSQSSTKSDRIAYLSMWQGPKTFNPITSNDGNSSEISSWLFSGLTSLDPHTGMPRPELARSWDVDTSGRRVVFHLRPGLRFSDGAPLTAHDVVFTFVDLVFDTLVNAPSRDILVLGGKQPRVEALNDTTVVFEMAEPFAPLLAALGGVPVLPRHLLAGRTGARFNQTWNLDVALDSVVGNGPWKLGRLEPGQRLLLVRNPHFWKTDSKGRPLPRIDTLLYSFVQNQEADLLRFRTGETDFMEPISARDYPVLKGEEAQGGYTIYRFGPSRRSSFVTFNQNTGIDSATGQPKVDPVKLKWFRDVRFRKAVSHAIDRAAIISTTLNGLGTPGTGPWSSASGYWYDATLTPVPTDLDSARYFLAQAGFTRGGEDNRLRDESGNPVRFTFVTNAENAVRVQVAGMIRKDLEALGMEVTFTQLEFNTILDMLDRGTGWELMMLGLTGGGPDPHFSANAMLSSGTTNMWFPQQRSPSTLWEREIDSLIRVGPTLLDTASRKKVYDRIQRIYREQQPMIYLEVPESIAGARDRFEGLDPTSLGGIAHNLDQLQIRPSIR